MSLEIRPDECLDQFLEGRLKLIQSRSGYRFSIDAVLLSEFVTVRPEDVVVDMGTGCGIILLIVLLTKPAGHAFGLEIQEALASQARRNAVLNGFGDKIGIILGDIRNPPMKKKSADVVICNPPYRKAESGRINPDQRKAIARHEILASMDDILRAAGNLLRKKGRLAMIYPSVRLVDILLRMRRFDLEPKKVRIIYPGLQSAAGLVLIEAVLDGKPGLEISPPLIGQGNFSI
jgi:tRNA1Val (adenine37-N6)-methyltransferase